MPKRPFLPSPRPAAALCAALALAFSSAYAVQAADRSPSAPLYARMPQSESMLSFAVSASQPSRVAFGDGRRIQSAVWEQNDADVKTDASTGQIFVQPHREGEIVIFITTEEGDTLALSLNASMDGAPQNIVLERRGEKAGASEPADALEADPRSSRMLPPMPVSDYEAALKTFLRAAALNRETASTMKLSRCPALSPSVSAAVRKLAALKPQTAACWRAKGLRAAVLHVKNLSPVPVELREPALIGPSILAIGLDRPILRLGESAELIFVEADDV